MNSVSIPIHRRRQVMLAAFTVLLHLVVFRWIVFQMGQSHNDRVHGMAPPVAAELVETPREPAPKPKPLAPPKPRLTPPPLPDLEPEPVEVASAPPVDAPAGPPAAGDPAAGAGATASGADGATANPQGTGRDGAAAGQRGAQAAASGAAPAADASAPSAPPAPPVQAPGRHYKIDLPPSADITLDVARVDADGTRWSGEQTLSWTLGKGSYSIRVEAALRVMFAHVNLLTLTSEGKLGDEGFVPTLMTEKRRGRSMTATHFNRDTNLLTFSASQARYPLVPYAQDKASVPLQLAAIARGDPKQFSGNIEFLVGEDRDASVFTFTVAGQEELQTRMGRINAWRVVRPPKPGSYSSRLELWLAPAYGWYPVQIRNVEASGATTTQTVTNIVIRKEAGS